MSGTITPQGAKNEALQVICATLLTSEEVIIKNIPDIRDVNNLIQLLKDIGVKVKEDSRGRNGERTYSFQASDLNLEYLGSDEFVEFLLQVYRVTAILAYAVVKGIKVPLRLVDIILRRLCGDIAREQHA